MAQSIDQPIDQSANINASVQLIRAYTDAETNCTVDYAYRTDFCDPVRSTSTDADTGPAVRAENIDRPGPPTDVPVP